MAVVINEPDQVNLAVPDNGLSNSDISWPRSVSTPTEHSLGIDAEEAGSFFGRKQRRHALPLGSKQFSGGSLSGIPKQYLRDQGDTIGYMDFRGCLSVCIAEPNQGR